MLGMGQKSFIVLKDRGVVRITGNDARDFLQTIVTNDVSGVSPAKTVWAALLSPQGKYLHDFFVIGMDDYLMLDCEKARAADLVARLGKYKLRSDVDISDVSAEWAVAVLLGTDADSEALVGFEGRGGPFANGVCYVDPRYGAIGARVLLPRASIDELLNSGFEQVEAGLHNYSRLCLGLPDGSKDLAIDKALPMENGFGALNGIDWDKGCYVGQEMTARMRYRATMKRQLLPVAIDGPLPEPGTPVMLGEQDAGEMRSSEKDMGLALLRIDVLGDLQAADAPLKAGDAILTPLRPPWLKSPTSETETESAENGEAG